MRGRDLMGAVLLLVGSGFLVGLVLGAVVALALAGQ